MRGDRLGPLVKEVFGDLGDERRPHRVGKCGPQQSEKMRPAHHDQRIEIAAGMGLPELRRDAPCKLLGLVAPRGVLATGGMVRGGSPPAPAERRVIELAAGTVGDEIPIVQMRLGVGQAADEIQGVVGTEVEEARLALIGYQYANPHRLTLPLTEPARRTGRGPARASRPE